MIDEMASGLRNALERGSSIESAVESFINAGYNPDEVREAARMITEGATALIANPSPQPQTTQP